MTNVSYVPLRNNWEVDTWALLQRSPKNTDDSFREICERASNFVTTSSPEPVAWFVAHLYWNQLQLQRQHHADLTHLRSERALETKRLDHRLKQLRRLDALEDRVRLLEQERGFEMLPDVTSYQGNIYFLQAEVVGHIKIGVTESKNAQRLKDLQTGSPLKLHLVGYAQAEKPIKVEHRLHARFQSARLHGEWFRPVPDLLAFIRSYSGKRLHERGIDVAAED